MSTTTSNRRTRRRSSGSEEEDDRRSSDAAVHEELSHMAGLLDIQQTLELWEKCADDGVVMFCCDDSKEYMQILVSTTSSSTTTATKATKSPPSAEKISKSGNLKSKDTSLLEEVKQMVKHAGLKLDWKNDEDSDHAVQQSAKKKKRKMTTIDNEEGDGKPSTSSVSAQKCVPSAHSESNNDNVTPNRFQDFVGATGLLCSVASFLDEVTLYCWEQAYPQLVDNPNVSGKRWTELAKEDERLPHGLIDDEDWTVFRELAGSRQDEENPNIVNYYDVKLAPQKEQRWMPFFDNPVTDTERGRQFAKAFLFTAARAKEADRIIFDFDKYAQLDLIPYRQHSSVDPRVVTLKQSPYWKQWYRCRGDEFVFVMISIRDDDTSGALLPRRSWGGYATYIVDNRTINLSGAVFDSLDFSEFRERMALQMRSHDDYHNNNNNDDDDEEEEEDGSDDDESSYRSDDASDKAGSDIEDEDDGDSLNSVFYNEFDGEEDDGMHWELVPDLARLGRKLQVTITSPVNERVRVATGGSYVHSLSLSNQTRISEKIVLDLHPHNVNDVWHDGSQTSSCTIMATRLTIYKPDTTEGPIPELKITNPHLLMR